MPSRGNLTKDALRVEVRAHSPAGPVLTPMPSPRGSPLDPPFSQTVKRLRRPASWPWGVRPACARRRIRRSGRCVPRRYRPQPHRRHPPPALPRFARARRPGHARPGLPHYRGCRRTGNVFEKGHRIRLEISSSNFPRFDRNPNTGTAVATETHPVKATETIYHDKQHPSKLVLMVM